MDTKHLVDPELLGLLEIFPTLELNADTLPIARAAAAFDFGPAGGVADVEVTASRIAGPGEAAELGVMIYRPRLLATPAPCIFHIHGGGYVAGSAAGAHDVSEYAAPARAKDLAKLPRTFISTGALDLFVDEDMEYARRLMRCGVAVELHVYPGAYHGFDLAPDADVSRRAQRDSVDALRRAMMKL